MAYNFYTCQLVSAIAVLFQFIMCCYCHYRNTKAKNRPSFRQIRLHLDIAAQEFIKINPAVYLESQVDTMTVYRHDNDEVVYRMVGNKR